MKKQKVRFEAFRHSIKCPKCGRKIRKADEEHHLTYECTKQFVQCRFCEIVLPREIASDHENYCGSKTAICKSCGDHVIVKDFDYHRKFCEGNNTTLPCEFCKMLVQAHELVWHQRKCLQQGGLIDTNFMRKEYNGEGLRQSTNNPNGNRGSVLFETQERDEIKEERAKEEFDEADQRVDRVSETRAKAVRESIIIVALPCEICGELCPSDKLMDHQIECQREREITIENDPDESLHASPRTFDSVFTRHDYAEKSGVRYFEVRRSYSPTIEFTDDDVSLESDIGFGSGSRDQRNSTNSPPSRQEGFATGRNSSASGVSLIEYQRGYSPEMNFEVETEPELFMPNFPTFCLTLEESHLHERGDSSRFNQVESRFREEEK